MNPPDLRHQMRAIRGIPIPLLLLVAAVGTAIVALRLRSLGLPEGGDDVAHYQHARYFWKHAEVALSQWGKPLFSFTGSFFAPLGTWGMTLMAVLCTVITALVMVRAWPAEDRGRSWYAVVLLFLVPVSYHTVLRGMTEPLFGLGSVLVAIWLLEERWRRAMLVLGALPFVRPEYAALVPFAVAHVLVNQRGRSLAFALLPGAVYCLLTGVLLGDPWRLFTHHTYVGNSSYGRGDPWRFVQLAPGTFGAPLLLLVVVAACLCAWLWNKRPSSRRWLASMAGLTLLPSLSIFLLHGYALWRGDLASAGLVRVMATMVPLTVLFVHLTLARMRCEAPVSMRMKHRLMTALSIVVAVTSPLILLRHERIIATPTPVQRCQQEAAQVVLGHRSDVARVVARDPMIHLLTEVDPWDSTQALTMAGFDRLQQARGARPGDLVIWDAHFARTEGGVSQQQLDTCADYGLLSTIHPTPEVLTVGDRPYLIRVYRKR